MEEEIRQIRMANEITKHISKILRDLFPGKLISVVRTEMADGVKVAYLFVSIYDENKLKTLKEVEKNKGKVREALAKALKIGRVPFLVFKLDESIEQSQKIYDVMSKIKGEE